MKSNLENEEKLNIINSSESEEEDDEPTQKYIPVQNKIRRTKEEIVKDSFNVTTRNFYSTEN